MSDGKHAVNSVCPVESGRNYHEIQLLKALRFSDFNADSAAIKADYEGFEGKITISPSNLPEFLGAPKYKLSKLDFEKMIGAANGLAWTSVGGEMMQIEVAVLEGNGKLELTGSLGDVMKESAKAAVSYIRANCEKLGVESDFYKTKDIHIHVPEGAVPKDGPSAGITIASAVFSALTHKKVRCDVAMTGEITLRGKV